MKVKRIYSRNADFQILESIKSNRVKRSKHGVFFIEGVRNINSAIKNKWNIASFIYDGSRKLSSWAEDMLKSIGTEVNYELGEGLMTELSSKTDPSELLALAEIRTNDTGILKLTDDLLLLLFDRPSNKGNLGTIIRSCDSFGVSALMLTGHAVDPYDPDVIAATQGSFFNMPIIRMPRVDKLREFIYEAHSKLPGFNVIGTTAHSQVTLDMVKISPPSLIMIGNEADGLCASLRNLCDEMAAISMAVESTATSLNVACAASILLYEARKVNNKHREIRDS